MSTIITMRNRTLPFSACSCYLTIAIMTENVWVYQGCFWHCICHDKCRLSWPAFGFYQGYTFHEKSSGFNYTIFLEFLANLNRVATQRECPTSPSSAPTSPPALTLKLPPLPYAHLIVPLYNIKSAKRAKSQSYFEIPFIQVVTSRSSSESSSSISESKCSSCFLHLIKDTNKPMKKTWKKQIWNIKKMSY